MKSWFLILMFSLFTMGCVQPYPYNRYGYGGYVAPVAPPPHVRYVAPIYAAPGPGWGWAYHPEHGYGWHSEGYGWRHHDRD